MKKKNKIGLDQAEAKKIADQLNILLANYQLFYMNTRAFHWNIKGEKFFELHLKFEELYNDSFIKIDEIAERILTLGFTPKHSFTEYLKLSKIKESKNLTDGKKAIKEVVKSFEVLLPIERKIHSLSSKIDDEGTSALMSDYIREQEKLVWMYSAFLGE
jgi:starvation-inducible DNA-binding protein